MGCKHRRRIINDNLKKNPLYTIIKLQDMNYSHFIGNAMATRNQIAFAVWTMKSVQIPRVKNIKQICLDSLGREQERIITMGLQVKEDIANEKALLTYGVGGAFSFCFRNLGGGGGYLGDSVMGF